MKPTDSNAAKAAQPQVAKPPPSEGVAPEPTIIAEQHRKPDKGPAVVKSDKAPDKPSSASKRGL